MKRLLFAALALVLTPVLTGCTPEQVAAWVQWNNTDPVAAQAFLATPEVQADFAVTPDTLAPAERLDPPAAPAPAFTGINGLPLAPDGLSGCDEMMFYANQFGLPARFEGIGWRESNCRNEDGVHTSCCWGYWQMHRMHFPMPACGINSYQDMNSSNPWEKQKSACATAQLYNAVGLSPWSATR